MIVHLKVALVPAVILVTAEVGDPGVAIVAVPDTTVQTPVPVVAMFPAKVKLSSAHWLISTPALAVVGCAWLVRTTLDWLAVQLPLEIVQVNVALFPAVMPVTVVVASEGLVIVAVPDVTVHRPVPFVGTFPAKVKLGLLH